jgi:hypothetical protein
MALLTESEVRARASRVTQRLQKSAGRVLKEDVAAAEDTFDIFLSHSSAEPEEILLGIKGLLEDTGLKVYVDKYSDPQLSPDNVTRQTAEILRTLSPAMSVGTTPSACGINEFRFLGVGCQTTLNASRSHAAEVA